VYITTKSICCLSKFVASVGRIVFVKCLTVNALICINKRGHKWIKTSRNETP
jgi:hypothetical protein